MNEAAFVIAILGAESSGKTQLALALAHRLRGAGLDAHTAAEHLREFCELHRRTPHQTGFEQCVTFDGRVAARIEHLTGDNINDRAHDLSFLFIMLKRGNPAIPGGSLRPHGGA